MKGIVFLDRDGTLIEDVGYLSDPREVREIPGAAESLLRVITSYSIHYTKLYDRFPLFFSELPFRQARLVGDDRKGESLCRKAQKRLRRPGDLPHFV